MSINDRIKRKFFGKKNLEMYRQINQRKFGIGALKMEYVLDNVGIEYIIRASASPGTKVYFYNDIYIMAYTENKEQYFQIGVDPDKNEFLIPYEE